MNAPSRYSQSQFNEMAPLLGEVLRRYPQAVEADPKLLGVSVETLARKFREAIAAKRKFNWPHEKVDDAKFDTYWKEIRTSMSVKDGSLFIGPSESLTNAKLGGNTFGAVASKPAIAIQVPLTSLSRLASIWGTLVPRPSGFYVQATEGLEDTQALLDAIERANDIGFVQSGEGRWDIL
jgi:hypothetical protein